MVGLFMLSVVNSTKFIHFCLKFFNVIKQPLAENSSFTVFFMIYKNRNYIFRVQFFSVKFPNKFWPKARAKDIKNPFAVD